MATGSMETALMSDPTIKLPDDLLVEVISRVPYKFTCCCKCVSTRWRDLISRDPNKRDDYSIKAVGIYSSEAGVWTHPIEILCLSGCAFFSRVLYLCPDNNSVAAVDVEGNCRIIPIPTSHDAPDCPNVYASQGQLYLTIQGASELSIWVLEDSSSENCWTLKFNVSYLRLFGIEYSSSEQYYGVISAHPEHNVIFIIKGFKLWYRPEKKLFSYDMDSGELCFICDLPWNSTCPYLSYVPLFSESLADGH